MPKSRSHLRHDSRPLYAQTVDALMDLLAEGSVPPGHYLPPEDELARQLGVSRSTIREAISHLEKDGLITRRHGIGTLVNERSQEKITGGLERLQSFRTLANIANESAEVIERLVSVSAASTAMATVLGVEPGAELCELQVIEAVNGCRTAVLDGVIPACTVHPNELAKGSGSLLDYLVDATEIQLGATRSSVYAIDADETLARRLAVPTGRSLLHLSEILFTTDDRPVALLRNYFLTECFNFTIYRRVVRPRRTRAERT